MKTSKRILATIVAVVLVITSLGLPTFAAFTDLAEDASSYTAVNVLNMLGIINGYDDGAGNFSFKPQNNVTRAEFTAMLLRTRGMGSVGSTSLENPPFPDVTTPDVSWAIGNIRTAREMGIINGYDDGTFKPNNNVSYEEAVKMIVCALGYGEMGSEGAFWYSKYLMTANSLGFLDGAGGAVSTPATREVIASMLYNCLEVKLAENNKITEKTILENDLKLVKTVGYIDSNPTISLSTPNSNLRDNEVQIAPINSLGLPTTYKVDDAAKYNDMLGAQITFYYATDREAGFKTIISATVKDTETIEIDASQIVNNSKYSIDYYRTEDAERTTSANIAANSIVVYNDKLYGSDKATSTFDAYCTAKGSAAMPSIGKVKLLDRDGDNAYDIVFINSYDAWVVSAVSTANESVTDNVLREKLDAAEKTITLKKSDNVKIVDASGNEVGFSAIKKGSVLSVQKDNHGGVTAVVTNNAVSGKIAGTNSKKGITINGKDYKNSKQAPWEAYAVKSLDGTKTGSTLTAPQYGDSGKFYLDIDGNILAYDKTEAVTTQYYGYIIDASRKSEDGFDETLRVNISTKSSPTGKIYTITTKTKINNAPVTDLATAEAVFKSGSTFIPQGVKFTVAKGNEIEEIITATPQTAGTDIETDKLYIYKDTGISASTEWKYNSTSKELYLESTPSVKIHIGSASIINVKGSSAKYKAMSTNDFSRTGTYKVEAFDMTKTGSAKFIIVHDGADNVGEVKGVSPVMVITAIERKTVGEDVKTVLTGYVGKDLKSEWALSVTDSETISNASTLKVGDVVRLGTDTNGDYTVKNNHIIFKTEAGYRSTAVTQPEGNTPSSIYPKVEKNDSNTTVYKVIWGSAYQYDGESGTRFIMSNDVLSASDTTSSNTTALEKSWFSNAKIFMYDANTTSNDKFIEVSDDYLNVLGGLTYVGQNATPTELFVYMNSSSSVRTLIIVKR